MSAVSRIRFAGMHVSNAHNCLEQMLEDLTQADGMLRSVHPRSEDLARELARIERARDLAQQLAATLPDTTSLFAQSDRLMAATRREKVPA